MSDYIHNTILLQVVKERMNMMPAIKNETPEMTCGVSRVSNKSYDETLKALLQMHGPTCICPSTVYRWMKHLGFNYEP